MGTYAADERGRSGKNPPKDLVAPRLTLSNFPRPRTEGSRCPLINKFIGIRRAARRLPRNNGPPV